MAFKVKIETKERQRIEYFIIKNESIGVGSFIPLQKLMTCGWGNGYVALPPGHPCWARYYEEINVGVHGGLTFGTHADEAIALGWNIDKINHLKGYYIVGFNTRHGGDTPENWPESRVLQETLHLKAQLEQMW